MTPAKLETEIITSVRDFGGRASIADISTDLGIDFTIVEETADAILEKYNLIKLRHVRTNKKGDMFLKKEILNKYLKN